MVIERVYCEQGLMWLKDEEAVEGCSRWRGSRHGELLAGGGPLRLSDQGDRRSGQGYLLLRRSLKDYQGGRSRWTGTPLLGRLTKALTGRRSLDHVHRSSNILAGGLWYTAQKVHPDHSRGNSHLAPAYRDGRLLPTTRCPSWIGDPS